jgi:MFS family permease
VRHKTGVVVALGTAQTLAWASSYYLPAILVAPMARDLGVAQPTVFAAFSAALLVSALLGPHAGRAIDRHGGRPVLIGSNVLFALGLAALGLAQGPLTLFAAWAVLGLAMGSGLYESAFAALVRLYGRDSRSAITGITLLAGFASTVGWPLSTVLEAQVGWRGACFAWAALHLLLGAPLNASLPKVAAPEAPAARPALAGDPSEAGDGSALRTTVLLSYAFAATWFVSTAMAAHLPGILVAGGASLAAAVAVGALVGPSQVAGRLLEFGFLRHVHPLLSARLAAMLHPVGAAVWLLLGAPGSAVFAVLHGAGNGILTIAKGTLPLVYFGPLGYGYRQGMLTVPTRLAQALAPWLFGLCLARWGAGAMILSACLGLTGLAALLLLPRPRGT